MIKTLADVIDNVRRAGLPELLERDLVSSINRVCEMAGKLPQSVEASPAILRPLLNGIRPARFRITNKTFANVRSLFISAVERVGMVDRLDRGSAKSDGQWGPLVALLGSNKRLHCGLASFLNWCVKEGVAPHNVSDEHVQRFYRWLEERTLVPKPKDIVRRVPNIWNEASEKIPSWPKAKLTRLSFRPPAVRVAWEEMPETLRRDVEDYLQKRAKPDLFDEDSNAPWKPLAPKTIHLRRNQIQSAISALVQNGAPLGTLKTLADILTIENYKTILRHYHEKAKGTPNAYLDSLGRDLIQVARYHVKTEAAQIARMKSIYGKLPKIPFDLTAKNKKLLSELESQALRRNLLFLPDKLLGDVSAELKRGRIRVVWAQVAIAVDVLLSAPIRCENLIDLHWDRHFLEPDGPKGRLILSLPAPETKTGREYVSEVPEDVAAHIRWYRKQMFMWLAAYPNGFLFTKAGGKRKSQETISQQIIEEIEERVGVHMTPHQFRHFAATLYLEDHPEDFETARGLLGHASDKTTRIYAGSSSRRASRAYGRLLMEKRAALKIPAKPKTRRDPKEDED